MYLFGVGGLVCWKQWANEPFIMVRILKIFIRIKTHTHTHTDECNSGIKQTAIEWHAYSFKNQEAWLYYVGTTMVILVLKSTKLQSWKAFSPRKKAIVAYRLTCKLGNMFFRRWEQKLPQATAPILQELAPNPIPYFYCCSCYILDEQLDNF